MDPHSDHSQPSRRVVLPSGRAIDVVVNLLPAEACSPVPLRSTPDAPECCPACASTLVQPVDWRAAPNERWSVDLRCPDCFHEDEVVLDQDEVDRYDELLDEGSRSLACDLDRLARANLEDAVRRFAAQLREGVLAPEDF